MKNPKAKGAKQERKAKAILEAAGFDVTKASASLGVFDIIAINRQGMRLIQVKSNYCKPEERETIKEYKNLPANGTKELWIFKDRIKEPIITIL